VSGPGRASPGPGQAGLGPGRAGSQWALESPGPKNSFGWAHVNKITYAPVFYTAPCVKCLMRASPLLGVGPGPSFSTFFGQNVTSPPKKVSNQGPGPTPCNGLARIKHFTHGVV
jgi:hypothetical protein